MYITTCDRQPAEKAISIFLKKTDKSFTSVLFQYEITWGQWGKLFCNSTETCYGLSLLKNIMVNFLKNIFNSTLKLEPVTSFHSEHLNRISKARLVKKRNTMVLKQNLALRPYTNSSKF